MFQWTLKRKNKRCAMLAALVAFLFSYFSFFAPLVKAAPLTGEYVVLTVEKTDQNGHSEYITEPIRVPYDSWDTETASQALEVGTGNSQVLKTDGPFWGQRPLYTIKGIADATQPSGYLSNGDLGAVSKWFCTVSSALREDPVSGGYWIGNYEQYVSYAIQPGDVIRFIYSADDGADIGITDTGISVNKDALLDYISGIDNRAVDTEVKVKALADAKIVAVSAGSTAVQVNDALNQLKNVFENVSLIPATDIVFSTENPEIGIGKSMNFTVTVLPEDTTDTLEVSFDQEGIVNYNAETHQLTGLREGMVKLTAKAGNLVKESTINVKAYPAEHMVVTPEKPTVMVKGTLQMNAVVQPENTTDTLSWRAEDETIASVDANGLVTGHREGKTKIFAEAGKVVVEKELTVTKYNGPYVCFEYTDGRIQEMNENNVIELSAVDEGHFVLKGTDQTPRWRCSTEFTEDVSGGSGGGSGVGHGTHYWINSYSGIYDPSHPQFSLQELDAKVLDEATIWEPQPTEILNFKIKLVSSGIEAVEAYADGKAISVSNPLKLQGDESKAIQLKGKKAGETTFKDLPSHSFRVLCNSENVDNRFNQISFYYAGEADFTVEMIDNLAVTTTFKAVSEAVKVSGLDVVVQETAEIDVWSTFSNQYVGLRDYTDFEIKIMPENASDKGVTWESLNPDIAEYQLLHSNGIVPKKAGKASFKVTSNDNPQLSKTFSVTFKYKTPLEKVEMTQTAFELNPYDVLDFTEHVVLTPQKATERCFDWHVDKEGIIAIRENHVDGSEWGCEGNTVYRAIEALKPGTVTVMGIPKDQTGGAQPIQFTVKVKGEVTEESAQDYLKLAKDNRKIGLDYLNTQSMKEYGDEWTIFSALRAGGEVSQADRETYYKSAVNTLRENGGLQATDKARIALTLGAMGYDVTNLDGINLIESMCNDPDLGKMSSNHIAFTLIAADSRNYEIPKNSEWNRERLVEWLMKYQAKDGAFSLAQGAAVGSIDMTGMCLQALAPYREDPQVKATINRALEYLKAKRTPEAGFKEGGSENSCTASQILTALTALGIDPVKAENGFSFGNKNLITNLNKFKAAGGGFDTYDNGIEDSESVKKMSGQQVTYGLDSYIRFAEGRNRLYDLTDVPVINSTEPPAPTPTPGSGNEGSGGNTGNNANQIQIQNSLSNQTTAKGNVSTGLTEEQNKFYGVVALMAVAALASVAVMRRRKKE